jgi:hypothetical protein
MLHPECHQRSHHPEQIILRPPGNRAAAGGGEEEAAADVARAAPVRPDRRSRCSTHPR